MKPLIVLLLMAAGSAAETSFDVERKKSLWPDQKGVLTITDTGVRFSPKGDEERIREWRFADIQFVERIGPMELHLLSYEDSAWRLGLDRRYRFVFVGEGLPDALFTKIAEETKAVADRVVAPDSLVEFSSHAKHLKGLGGPEGTLRFSPERVTFASEEKKASREWLLERDVESVWSSDPYRLQVHVWEVGKGAMRKPKVYTFALKERLDVGFYKRLKKRLYALAE